MAVGLDGSFVFSQSFGSDPALGPTKGHLTCHHSSHLLVTLIPLKQRKKEGIRVSRREGGRREKSIKEEKSLARLP